MRQMYGRGKIADIASLFTENLPWDRKKNKDEFPGFEATKKRVVFLKIWNWEVTPALITESIRGFWTGVYLTVLDLEFE